MSDTYIGLMSGTSLDGVDGVLVDFARASARSSLSASDHQVLRVVGHVHRPFAVSLIAELLALNASGHDELHRAALAANAVARRYAEVIDALLAESATPRGAVRAIGAHGQTVRHRPGEFDGTGYTLQLGNAALLAELAGIDVVADLRGRDVAAGGQGAPLVPAFHRAVFGRPGEPLALLNIGGIANLTSLGADGSTLGFDCGPGNALMDHWCHQHTGRAYDDAGVWAASGQVLAPLLASMRADPYFSVKPPKSTGRDLFNAAWLTRQISACKSAPSPVDVQATLAELTAVSCAADVRSWATDARRVLVCGGGTFNAHLMARLAAHLPSSSVASTDTCGLPPDQVEACAFAWLAKAFVDRRTASLASVTGARGPRLLGALYPAG